MIVLEIIFGIVRTIFLLYGIWLILDFMIAVTTIPDYLERIAEALEDERDKGDE